jgi:hypothetical protein
VTSQAMGETQGSGIDFDDHPMGSVVYMGRGSFRMEAIALEPVSARGVVQPMMGIVTAPLHTTPFARRNEDAADDDSPRHRPRALFGSQVDVPLLAAPTGSVSLRAAPAVTLSRATLGALGALVLLCGIVVGTAARHLLASPAPLTTVAAPAAPVSAPVPVKVEPSVAAELTPAPLAATASTPANVVPSPVTVRARPSVAVKRAPAPAARVLAPKPASNKPWVDPWAN